MNTVLLMPVSFPRPDVASGWVDGFHGWVESGLAFAAKTIEACEELDLDTVLWRGVSGCAPPDAKWECGRREDWAEITTGVRSSATLTLEEVHARRQAVERVHKAGIEVWYHDGPALTNPEATVAAHILAADGVARVALDSTGNMADGYGRHQLSRMRHLHDAGLGPEPLVEPFGNRHYRALTNAERRIPWEELARGQVFPDDLVPWLNDPSDEVREDPRVVVMYLGQAGVPAVVIPGPVLRTLRSMTGGGVKPENSHEGDTVDDPAGGDASPGPA